ncbi:MAG: zinc ribbon domain-containing protein [Clostridiales bacterium]|jgi:hypothetical protein|nr:zinc ribbon domain-containing protein [Clostridiales bacterium]
MKPSQIYSKTMPFVWAKLLLRLAAVVIAAVIFAALMGIARLFNNEGVFAMMFLIWLSVTGVVNFALNHYMGYLVKAGHIAVITEAVVSGRVPNNQVAYGKQMVKERFAASNVYFAVDQLVSGAVKQLQNVLEKAGNALGFVPGMDAAVKIGKLFIGIALGYIDECCLGYTFYKKEQGAFRTAADGVVIYAQNRKKLLKDAAKTTVAVLVLTAIVTLVSFLLFGMVFRMLGWNGFAAFLLACLVAWAVKSAFIDSYMMIKMMTSYMSEAPTTVITFDLYSKLCGWSAKFKELFQKGQKESPAPQPAHATAGISPQSAAGTATVPQSTAADGDKPVFCGACGAKNPKDAKFCGACSKPMA